MKRFGLIILLVNILSVATGQGIKSTWFFDEDRFFKLEDERVDCEPFDFITGYKIHGDSLTFKHFYKLTIPPYSVPPVPVECVPLIPG
jgi:hypothetical protein